MSLPDKKLAMKDRKPLRLKHFDYSLPGWYFVTFCIDTDDSNLSSIVNKQVTLNKYGSIVAKNWKAIPQHQQLVKIDESVIMPNHFHGILILLTDKGQVPKVGEHYTLYNHDLHEGHFDTRNIFSKHKHLLSKAVGGHKSASSKEIRRNGRDEFKWQTSFHDRIIRNEKELANIRSYIRLNPALWQSDPDCISGSTDKQREEHYEAVAKQDITNSTSNIQNSK
jgi:REP element-mobilizing transposase RayT